MDGLKLDVGVYMKALEVQQTAQCVLNKSFYVSLCHDQSIVLLQYACDVKAEVFGKPSPLFFQSALNDMGLQPHEVRASG